MVKIFKNNSVLIVSAKIVIITMLLLYSFASCCVTGYCQVDDTSRGRGQVQEETDKKLK